MEADSPIVSIVVASHRARYIHELLGAFDDRALGAIRCEILVVADYPVEKAAAAWPSVRWYHVPDRSIPRKRNTGIRHARARLVAFIDDDCLPAEHWIPHCVRYLESHPDEAGVEGQTLLQEGGGFDSNAGEYRRLEQGRFRANNVCYRREVLEEVGLFDERFTVQREDMDLAFTLIESGHTIGYNNDMRVFHRVRPNEQWDLLKNCLNRRFDPLLYRKHPRLYRHYVKSPFPPSLRTMLAWLLGAGGAAVAKRPLLVPIAVSSLAGAGALAARRGGARAMLTAQGYRNLLSFLVAPLVLLGALLYGSLRFRKLLIV